MSHEQLPLYICWIKVIKYLLQKTEKFPKKVRFTFSNRLDNLALDVLEKIVEVCYSGGKYSLLKTVNLNIEKLRVLSGLCHERKYLDHRGYDHLNRLLDEAGKQVGGWQQQQLEP